jgi:hypothetical protein
MQFDILYNYYYKSNKNFKGNRMILKKLEIRMRLT